MKDSKICKSNKYPNNKLTCCNFPKPTFRQRAIRAVPYSESILPSPDSNAFGYRFDPGPIISFGPITEIPFKSIGPLSSVIATQNGLSVPAGVYEVIAQVTVDPTAPVVGILAIAINGIPINTTTFFATSGAPSSGAITLQSLQSGDVITLVALDPPGELILTTGNLTIKKLN